MSNFESLTLLRIFFFLNDKINLPSTQLCLKVRGPSTFGVASLVVVVQKIMRTHYKEAARGKLLV